MYFSRITLRDGAQKYSEFWRDFRSPYSLHRSIWNLFGDSPARKRDFLYRLDHDSKRPLIYTVSNRKPISDLGMWNVATKPYKPRITNGMKLAFMLRANPIRTRRDEHDRQHRHDVIMDAKTRLKNEGNEPEAMANLVQDEGERWLLERAEKNGFEIQSRQVRADGYRQHRFRKSKGGRVVKFSTIEFTGLLRVTDKELFLEILTKGIGPAKGFGCGMMMVRRA